MRFSDFPISLDLQTEAKPNRIICPVTAMEGRGMQTYDFEATLSGTRVTCAVRDSESASVAAGLVESYLKRLASERGLELAGDFQARVAAAISQSNRSRELSLGEVARPAT